MGGGSGNEVCGGVVVAGEEWGWVIGEEGGVGQGSFIGNGSFGWKGCFLGGIFVG